jgi:hypothetical protein
MKERQTASAPSMQAALAKPPLETPSVPHIKQRRVADIESDALGGKLPSSVDMVGGRQWQAEPFQQIQTDLTLPAAPQAS